MEETVYVVDEDDDEENVRTIKKQSEMLFVRGMARNHTGAADCNAHTNTRGLGCPDITTAMTS